MLIETCWFEDRFWTADNTERNVQMNSLSFTEYKGSSAASMNKELIVAIRVRKTNIKTSRQNCSSLTRSGSSNDGFVALQSRMAFLFLLVSNMLMYFAVMFRSLSLSSVAPYIHAHSLRCVTPTRASCLFLFLRYFVCSAHRKMLLETLCTHSVGRESTGEAFICAIDDTHASFH